MHMADALLSPAVGVGMWAVSVGTLAYAVRKVKQEELSEKKLPLMAVAGAFVFAAQMINFTIPGTGSSGHIGGGILLAALLGSYPALLTIAVVLTIQCLFFADGGLLALGCNIFNMGVIPCLVVFPVLFNIIAGKGQKTSRLSIAAVLSVLVGLELGAFGVVLETTVSGIMALPFGSFAAVMLSIHLAIGLVEGLVTAAILSFVVTLRPEILESAFHRREIGSAISLQRILTVFALVTIVVAGGLSLAASAYPDGLEWSMERVAGTTELEVNGGLFDLTASLQETTAILPDYDYAGENDRAVQGTTAAGLIGSLITFVLAGSVGWLITKIKKRQSVSH